MRKKKKLKRADEAELRARRAKATARTNLLAVAALRFAAAIKLIVGLGNPGSEYRGTRHNAGADFVDALARQCGHYLAADSKFFGLSGALPCRP